MPAEQKENSMVVITDKVNYEKELKRLASQLKKLS